MMWHIVRFRFPADVDDEERRALERDIEGLADAVDEVVWLTVARDVADPTVTGLISLFEDAAGLDAYREHPVHVPVAERARQLSEEVTRLDVAAGSPASASP